MKDFDENLLKTIKLSIQDFSLERKKTLKESIKDLGKFIDKDIEFILGFFDSLRQEKKFQAVFEIGKLLKNLF